MHEIDIKKIINLIKIVIKSYNKISVQNNKI